MRRSLQLSRGKYLLPVFFNPKQRARIKGINLWSQEQIDKIAQNCAGLVGPKIERQNCSTVEQFFSGRERARAKGIEGRGGAESSRPALHKAPPGQTQPLLQARPNLVRSARPLAGAGYAAGHGRAREQMLHNAPGFRRGLR